MIDFEYATKDNRNDAAIGGQGDYYYEMTTSEPFDVINATEPGIDSTTSTMVSSTTSTTPTASQSTTSTISNIPETTTTIS